MLENRGNRLRFYKLTGYGLVFATLLSMFLFVEKRRKLYTGKEKPSKYFIKDLNIDSIDEIIIDGGVEIQSALLKKKNGIWQVAKEGVAVNKAADTKTIVSFLSSLKQAKVLDRIAVKPAFLEKYMLTEKDGGVITLKSSGETISHFILGFNDTVAETAFVRILGSSRVLKLDKSVIVHLLEKASWVDTSVFGVLPEEISEVSLGFDGTAIVFRLAALPEGALKARWYMYPGEKKVNPGRVGSLLLRISHLKTSGVPGFGKPEYFLNPPLKIEVKLKNGRTIHVLFGSRIKDKYWVRRENDMGIFLVEKHHFNAFTYPVNYYLYVLDGQKGTL